MSFFSEQIKIYKNEVLETWEKRVRSELSAARNKSKLALYDSLPLVLDEIAESLENCEYDVNSVSDIRIAIEHARQRSEMPDYNLEQVILEYNILRTVLFEKLETLGTLSIEEVHIIWTSVFYAIKNSSTMFAKIRQKEELEESENKYKAIIDGVTDYALFTLDPNGFITFWNAGAERMKGYTYEEAIGSHFSMLYPEEAKKRNEPMNHLKSARIEGRFRGEGLRIKKNGELFMADVYIVPLKKGKEVVGFAKIVADLSEHNQLIQERDISRTEALNLKLQNEMRETFVAVLSHDLRSPLSAAKTSAQLILRHPMNHEKHLVFATKIVDHINRIDKMLINFLDANILKAGEELTLHKSRCNLIDIAHDVVDEISTIYGQRIHIYGSGPVIGFWDGEGLRRVLENLLSNAVKYGDLSKPISLNIDVINDRVIIKVHNYGPVIEIPDQLMLFEKFHRTKSAHSGTQIGWGLGLTLVKGIVEAHKGLVQVESYPKEGTTFLIDLPYEEGSDYQIIPDELPTHY